VAPEAVGNMKTKEFLDALDHEAIAKAIGEAEKRTSGEIRVFVTEHEVKDAVAAAQEQFLRLGMAKTELRNGVLLYFAPRSRAFAVIGDKAIHERCGQSLWEEVTVKMTPLLKADEFTKAIIAGVERLGMVLAKEFPWKAGDRNELPNTVVRDESEK
jgi:uncharacterized membrane protein